MFIAQTSGLHHSIARCLVSLETKFQFRDTFRHKMTVKILEHMIGELFWTARRIIGQLYFPVLSKAEDELSDRPPSSYNFAVSDWFV